MRIPRIVLTLALLATVPALSKPLVVASFTDVAALTRSVAGDLVNLQVVMPAGADPHTFSVTADQIRALQSADLVIFAHSRYHEFEATIESALTRTPTLDWPDYEAQGAKLYDYPGYQQNPHGPWLHLDNARAMARAIAARLPQLGLPAESLQANLAQFERELAAQQEMNRRLGQNAPAKPVLAVIPGVCDIIANLGLPVAGVLMAEGSGTVTGQQMNDAIQKLRTGQYAGLVCPLSMRQARQGDAARQISADANAPIAWVRFLDADLEKDTYLSVAAYNGAALASLMTAPPVCVQGVRSHGLSAWLGALVLVAVVGLIIRLRRRRSGVPTGAGIFDK